MRASKIEKNRSRTDLLGKTPPPRIRYIFIWVLSEVTGIYKLDPIFFSHLGSSERGVRAQIEIRIVCLRIIAKVSVLWGLKFLLEAIY